ncbi:O-antigen ligase family protein [bacterium]|nr:MAG: O-antigen ligase family protein [bacterium]
MSKIIDRMNSYFVSREIPKLEAVELLSLAGILVSIFFPIRYVLENSYATILGYYSDFTSISIYIGFAFVLIFIGINIYREIKLKKNFKFWLIISLVFTGLLIVYQVKLESEAAISFYHHLRITCVLLLGYSVYKSPTALKYKKLFLWICVLLGGIQGVIAVLQFSLQHSLGLNLLGESPLSVTMYGVAKAVSHGTTYIRGYGTLPHPNILAGVLVIVSLFNIYLLNNTLQLRERVILSVTYILMVMGIFASLSRGGMLALVLGFTTWLILNSYRKKSVLFVRKLWVVPIGIAISITVFYPWIVSRGTIESAAKNLRNTYNATGVDIIRDNWLVGTGPGTNMFHMKQRLSSQLEQWDIQPIHNFWLITWSELGITGLIVSFFMIKVMILSIWRAVSRGNTEKKISTGIAGMSH